MRFSIKKLFSTIWRTITTISLIILLIVVSTIILLYTSGYLHERLRILAIEQLENYSKRKVYIESVTGNLITNVTVNGLIIAQEDDLKGRKCIDVESVTVQYNIFDFFQKNIRLREVKVKNPHIFLGKNKEGKWSLKEVFRPSVDYDRGPSRFKMTIDRIIIQDAYYEMDIEKSPVKKYDDVNLLVNYKVEKGIHTIDILEGDLNLIEYDEPVDKFNGRVVVGNGVVMLDSIQLENEHSGFVTNGLIQYSPEVTYNLSTQNAHFDGYSIEEDIFGKEFISGDFIVNADINGTKETVEIRGDVKSNGGYLLDYPYSYLEFPVNYQLGLLDIEGFKFNLELGDINGDVQLYHQNGEVGYSVSGEATDVNASKFQDKLEIGSSINLDFVFAGSGFNANDLNSDFFFLIKKSTYGFVEIDTGYGNITFKDRQVQINDLTTRLCDGIATSNGVIDFDNNIDIKLGGSNINIHKFIKNFHYNNARGYLFAEGHITGKFNSPDVFTELRIDDFKYNDLTVNNSHMIVDIKDSLGKANGNATIFGNELNYDWVNLSEFSTIMKFEPGKLEFKNLRLKSREAISLTSSFELITSKEYSKIHRDLHIHETDISFRNNHLLSFNNADISFNDNSISVNPLNIKLLSSGELNTDEIIIGKEEIKGSLVFSNLNLNYLQEIGLTTFPITGNVNNLSITGNGDIYNPELKCNIDIEDGPIDIADNFKTTGEIIYKDYNINIKRLSVSSKLNDIIFGLHGNIPIDITNLFLNGDPFNQGVELYCSLNNLDIGFINNLTDQIYIENGYLTGGISIIGRMDSPSFNGMLEIMNCNLIVGFMGKELEKIKGTAYILNNEIIIPYDDPITARADNGEIKSYGTIDFSNDVSKPEFSLDFIVENVVLTGITDVTGIITANARLTGIPGYNLLLDADVEVLEGLITTEFYGGGDKFSAGRDSMDLDLSVEAEKGIWLRNSSSDIEFSCDVIIKRTDGRYNFTGTLSAMRGYYYFLRKDFKVESGEVIFEGGNEINPRLDIIGEIPIRESGGELSIIYIYIRGHLKEPEITLYSPEHPDLDQKDILTVVALDMTWEEYERMTASEFASMQSRTYIENYISDEISRSLRKGTHLDTIRIRSNLISGSGEPESLRITVGKYLTSEFYISYTRDIYTRSGETLQGEYYLGKNFSFLGKTFEQDGEFIYSFILKYKYKY